MSALTGILSDVLDALYSEPSPAMCNKDNGMGLFTNDFYPTTLVSVPLYSGYLKALRHLNNANIENCPLQQGRKIFKVNVDVKQFKPEEISVKVIGEYIVVEAKHDEREDKYGLIARQFTRRYKISDYVDCDNLISTLSSDGILTLAAPIKGFLPIEERNIPIVQTNEPALNGSENNFEDSSKNPDI